MNPISKWFAKQSARAEARALDEKILREKQVEALDKKHANISELFGEAGLTRIQWANTPVKVDPSVIGYFIGRDNNIYRYFLGHSGELLITKL